MNRYIQVNGLQRMKFYYRFQVIFYLISITILSCQADDPSGPSLSLKQVHYNLKEKLTIKGKDYHHFYRMTQGIRERETLSRFMAEQKIHLNNKGQFTIVVGYADTRLKYTHPQTHKQILKI